MIWFIFKGGETEWFKRTISDMSLEAFEGSGRRRKGRKCNTSWGIHFLVGEEQQNFLLALDFCYLLVNVNCLLALGRFLVYKLEDLNPELPIV